MEHSIVVTSRNINSKTEHKDKSNKETTIKTISNNTANKKQQTKNKTRINKRNISETFVAAKTKINIKAGGEGQLELTLNY